MNKERFTRGKGDRSFEEELRRLRERESAGNSLVDQSAAIAALQAQVTTLQTLMAQILQGGVVVRAVTGTDEEQVSYIEFDGNDFGVSGSGSVRRVDLGVGTTKGDLIAWNNTPQPARLPVGANKTYLVADSAQTLGVKWQGPTGTYTPTNVTTDRSYDADATTLAELADVVGTMIADLQAVGILG